uniref:NACHT domain-containing protein n=1 Tax=Amphimedon queenslandica TaxID=400682 RepID=A0A1X7T5M3_AMPQE
MLGLRGQSNVAEPISSIPDDVLGYADNMRQHYRDQPIVPTDWPPKIGKDSYFGRLVLVEKKASCSTPAESDWYYTRGQVDKIVQLSGNKVINAEEVLKPTDSSLSLRVVIDGPPGIGKTTLCRKLLNMWSNGKLQQYDLVLYCPLRNSKIATATTLADLFVRQLNRYKNVPEWFEERDGKGLLIIFDGWDELSEQLRQSSLAASIIRKDKLDQCSVIVTSRSYASSSLLKMDTLSRHVQVIGFSKEEISTVIIQTLQKDARLAQELINENTNARNEYKLHFTTMHNSKDSQLAVKLINGLKVRGDVRSLCYIPLVCSMVILVYCKKGGHLPTKLTELYEIFILQTIRRHVEIKPKHDIDPFTLGSLSSLPLQLARPLQEMCQLAYTNLANRAMVFSLHEIQPLSQAVKEDFLGLMATFREYDEVKYQFLHLSIQEFLAAWWIAKHEKTEEVFKDHFDDDHFRMCLSLNTLNLPLDTAESAIELFTILQTNTTLETLNVEIKEERVYTSSMGTSLQYMLTQNQTLKYFEINNDIPSSFLSFLTTGLRHNTSIKHLNVYIPLNTGVTYFIEAISKKDNLKEINLNFILELDQSHSCSEEQRMTPLFYEHLLPAITSMLQSHTTIIELRIGCTHINGDWSEPHWIEPVKKLYDTIFIHPSLEYIEFNNNRTARFTHRSLEDTLRDQEMTLIERCRNEQPGKPLPIVDLNIIKLN